MRNLFQFGVSICLIGWFAILLPGCATKDKNLAVNEIMDTIPHDRMIHGQLVRGKIIDNQTRCSHYHSEVDVIAIKFRCCNTYYHCYSCHEETSGHRAQPWPVAERDTTAIMCGVCGSQLTINEYMNCNNTCPTCQSSFNPNCKKHYHLYFEMG